MVSGAVLFARYAYPPNELGYCGPSDSTLLEHADEGELARRARAFTGAWVYLEVLADAVGLDPLDPRVVEAYWVGNELLDAVDPERFTDRVQATFAGQTGGRWRTLALPGGEDVPARAHHSFHVLEVYPWVGLLRTGNPAALRVLDRCRIRWGEVVEVDGEHVVVTSRPLSWDGTALAPGDERLERARWSIGGRSWLPGLAAGEQVSLHWDWVCDRLDEASRVALETRESSSLAATNRWLATSRA